MGSHFSNALKEIGGGFADGLKAVGLIVLALAVGAVFILFVPFPHISPVVGEIIAIAVVVFGLAVFIVSRE